MNRQLLMCASICGLLAVAFGAFGAHGLEDLLDEHAMVTYETGVKYHFYHALAMMMVGLTADRFGKPAVWSGWLFLIGIVLFSGTLYVLAMSGMKWLGMITPLGGLSLMAGWVTFFFAVLIDQNTGDKDEKGSSVD